MTTTGPFSKASQSAGKYYNNPVYKIMQRQWYRQSPKTDSPLPFVMAYHERFDTTYTDGRTYAAVTVNDVSDAYVIRLKQAAYNTAYSQFTEKVGSRSQWATNYFERKQAVEMIVARTGQLFRFARALNRFDLKTIAKMFKIPRGFKAQGKSFGDLFLEFHFGWAPLAEDIHSACKVLTDGPPQSVKIKGRGSMIINTKTRSDLGSRWSDKTTTGKVCAEIGGRVSCLDNGNAWLMQQLGLTNPAEWIWESIPFSFVVDWFANVGQLLGSFSNFYGVTLTQVYVTSYRHYCLHDVLPVKPGYTGATLVFDGRSAYVNRTTPSVPPGPKFVVKPWKPISVTRAATAISLLLQQLR